MKGESSGVAGEQTITKTNANGSTSAAAAVSGALTVVERLRRSGQQLALSSAKKLRAAVDTQRAAKIQNALPYAVRSGLPAQNEKVSAPVELLYYPARLPM